MKNYWITSINIFRNITLLAILGLTPIFAAAIGPSSSYRLHNDGTVYAWGVNWNGQLGDNTTTQRNVPIRVLKGAYSGTTYLGDNSSNKIIMVSAGSNHAIALAEDGTVFTWGYNYNGQLGDGFTNTTTPYGKSTPQQVLKGEYGGTTYLGDNSSNKIIAVAAGQNHSMALAADGTVYTWGYNLWGQLGIQVVTNRSTPVKVLKGAYSGTTYLGDNSSNKITAISAGDHSIALTEDGTVFTWGPGAYGQLGNNDIVMSSAPVKVLKGAYSGTTYLGDDSSNKIISISASYNNSISLATNGTVYTWGYNYYGQLGDSTTTQRNTPVEVLKGAYSGTTYLGDNSSDKIISVASSDYHMMALATNGTVFTWGANWSGRLGDNTTTQRNTPVEVLKGAYSGTTNLGDNSANKMVSIAVGGEHSYAQATDGSVFAWGENWSGVLGDNTTTAKSTPVQVLGVGGTGFLDVGAAVNITVINPNGGESWNEGTSNTITWSDDIDDYVKIELYRGNTLTSTVADSTPSDSSYSWAIPTGLVTAADYKIRITGLVNSTDVSDSSDAAFTINATPGAPQNLSAVPGDNQVTISWTASGDSDRWFYKIYRYTADSSQVSTALTDSIFRGTTSFTDTGLITGTAYYYWVSVVDSARNESSKSSVASATPSATWWVATDGDDDNNAGTTEAAPFKTLSKAISSAVSGNSIRVKAGTYSGANNRSLNPNKYLIISSVSGADSTIIDAGGFARHFTFDAEIDSSSLIGFTLRNGNGDGYAGGSIWINNSNPTIQNCIFENNSVTGTNHGGAIYIDAGTGNSVAPEFTNCTFRDNTAERAGGAIYITGNNSTPKFTNCNIISNDALNTSSARTYGGGVYIAKGAPEFIDTKIDSNRSQSGTGYSYGGGIYINSYENFDSPVKFTRCYIRGNSAIPTQKYALGGAMYIRARVEIVNCVISGNEANAGTSWGDAYGGGIYMFVSKQNNPATAFQYDEPEVRIINSTIVGNTTSVQHTSYKSYGGGIYVNDANQNLIMFNSIIWANVATESPSIWDGGRAIRADYNDIQGGTGQSNIFGANSKDFDPGFTGISTGDYSLSNASHVIGAGTSIYDGIYSAPATDILGNIRPNPSGSSPDLGAFENALGTSPYPGQVTGLTAQGGASQVTLNWTANPESDISKYKIYKDTVTVVPNATTLVGDTTATTYTVSGLDNATRYYFRVVAVNTGGYEGLASASVDITPLFAGPVWWVATDGVDTNEGSQGLPFLTLSKGLTTAAAGDTIRIKKGTYYSSGNSGLDPGGKNLVIIGHEGADSTIFDAENADRHFNFSTGENSTFKITGITFKFGKRTSGDGGSVYIYDSSPTFENCVFENNQVTGSDDGGAVYIYTSSSTIAAPKFNNCTFRDNITESEGGAIYINSSYSYDSAPQFNNCNIVSNDANNASLAYKSTYGGGICINKGKPEFNDCKIDSNQSNSGDYSSYGGGVYIEGFDNLTSPIEFTRCYFRGNSVNPDDNAWGGGIYTQSRISLINCQITGNEANGGPNSRGYGGGIHVNVSSQWDGSQWVYGEVRIINSTIAGNQASFQTSGYSSSGGGIYVDDNWQELTMFNSIIWGNTADNFRSLDDGGASPTNDYNDIEDASIYSWTGTNTLQIPPGFKGGGDYSLSDASFCIGAGTSSFNSISAPSDDIQGGVRPSPSATSPDLGAFENSLGVSPYPAQVVGLTATGGSQQVTLNWTANTETDLKMYKIYKDTAAFAPSTTTLVGDTTATTFTITGLSNVTRYYFQVTAVDSSDYEGLASRQVDITPAFNGPVWWVATDGATDNEGSEGSPLLTLDAALDSVALTGDTVMVKAGTYHPTWFGGGIDPRDSLSVVIISEKGADSTIIDGDGTYRHFIFNSEEDSTFQIIGFTFKGGKRGSDQGGSMKFEAFYHGWPDNFYKPSSPTIKNCIFENNLVTGSNQGGAIYIYRSSPRFINCVFKNNSSEYEGGAVYSYGSESNPQFNNCTFLKNSASNPAQTYNYTYGGAVFINDGTPLFTDCAFDSNTAYSGDYESYGGAVYINSFNNLNPREPVKFIRCFFRGNSVTPSTYAYGGALVIKARANLVNCVITGNFVNAGGSYGDGNGGGIFIELGSHYDDQVQENITGKVTIVNTTIADNEASAANDGYSSYGGGIQLANNEQRIDMFNSIVWGNAAENDSSISVNGGTVIGGYNDIERGDTYSWFGGSNSVMLQPGFTDQAGGDYSLSDASKVIGIGTTSFTGISAPSNDIMGNLRPNPSDTEPDLGAYENALGISPYPDEVLGLTALGAQEKVYLNWKANPAADSVSFYKIYSSQTPGFAPAADDSVGITVDTSFTVLNLTNNETYYFRVSAVNTDTLEGPASGQVSAIARYSGPNWWVATDGDNSSDGDVNNPFSDLARAIEVARSGDTIIFKEGIHGGIGNRDIKFYGIKSLHIRSESGAAVTVLDAQSSDRHMSFFGPVDTSFVISGITFRNGWAPNDGSGWFNGGSIMMVGGDYWDEATQQNYIGNPRPRFYNCLFENNQAGDLNNYGQGGAVQIFNAEPWFENCEFSNNTSGYQGGAIAIASPYQNQAYVSNPVFKDCIFRLNRVENNGWDRVAGGAVFINDGGNPKFIACLFENNQAVANGGNTANGGAVCVNAYWDTQYFNNILFARCIFSENEARGNGGGYAAGGALNVGAPVSVKNCLIKNNKAQGEGWAGGGGIYVDVWDRDGSYGPSYIINNTIVGNQVLDGNGNDNFDGGGIQMSSGWRQTGAWFNNIIYGNRAANNRAIFWEDSGVDIGHICADDGEGSNWWDSNNMISEDPKFINPGTEDYRLSFASPLIDAGADNFAGITAPQWDIRKYFRLGTTDIGAYEAGASKYILAVFDDIDTTPRDTTFLSLEQEFTVTVETRDNLGNLVTESAPVSWFLTPSDKHATIMSGDTVTTEGSASAVIKATGIAGFKFRVGINIGDGTRVTDLYIIDHEEFGMPPAVTDLAINPDGWSPQKNFNISWTNPDETAYGREFIGAFVKIGDDYPQLLSRTPDVASFDVSSAGFEVPEQGTWDVRVWLVDELGNEDESTAAVVQAMFDNQPPDEFYVSDPCCNDWHGDKPRFRWERGNDYPSGVSGYELMLDNNVFEYYDISQVTDEGGGIVYVDVQSSIPEGQHEWYINTFDYAGNMRESEERLWFGVDVNPPNIDHNNPLTQANQGQNTGSIDVNIWDDGVGVGWARLYYRMSGTGGWNEMDLQFGSVNIPGSGVNSDGLEYYIEASDQLGNESRWPDDGRPFHSVNVITNMISTSGLGIWPGGIPGGSEAFDYQFFSIPFNVGNVKNIILQTMGDEYDNTKWRFYGYEGDWIEFESLNSVEKGKGYFFIHDEEQHKLGPIQFEFGSGSSNSTDPPYTISTPAGNWVFFGNPYNYHIPINMVYTDDGTSIQTAGSLWGWDGSWNGVGGLDRWQGYIYKSDVGGNIYIDGRGDEGSLSKLVDYDEPFELGEWQVDVSAATGALRDAENRLGARINAKDGHDILDKFEPPTVPGDISLRIDNRSRAETADIYSRDMRAVNENGYFWDLEVLAPNNGRRTYVTFDGLGYIPQEFDVFLVNKTTKTAQNLKWDHEYTFANSGPKGEYYKQDFRFLVGNKEFLNTHNEGIELYPDAYQLSQNYPNPFNPQTSITISMEDDGILDMVVYNILGEEVSRLAVNEYRPAGYYNFIWNGTNVMGSRVSTGVYFYHALIKNTQGKVVLNKTRKMVLMK